PNLPSPVEKLSRLTWSDWRSIWNLHNWRLRQKRAKTRDRTVKEKAPQRAALSFAPVWFVKVIIPEIFPGAAMVWDKKRRTRGLKRIAVEKDPCLPKRADMGHRAESLESPTGG